nr:class A sortase [uncultured Peptostreptococcus sp.]
MKKLGALLILIGIVLISMPKISEYMLIKKSQDVNIAQLTEKDLEKNAKDTNRSYDASKVNAINVNGVILHRDRADLSKVVGQLVIPSINKNIAIFDGLEDNSLLYGACNMKPNQHMGQGNYAIAGHYHENDKILFGGLVKVKIGDTIKITNKKTIYEYKAIKTMKVKDDRIDLIEDKVIDQYDSKPIISLMTCYYNVEGYRYFVIGQFEKEYPYSKEKMLDGISE